MTKKTKVTITVDDDLWQEYKKLLMQKGYKFSTRIEVLVRNDMEMMNNDIV